MNCYKNDPQDSWRLRDMPADAWHVALPVLDAVLGRLQADEVARFATDWATLAKARNFAWTLADLTGRRPGARGAARWSVDELAAHLTAVPLTGVTAPARAMYARLMRLVDGLAPVPEPPTPGLPQPRQDWVAPTGAVGDVIAALAAQLAMPVEHRTATSSE